MPYGLVGAMTQKIIVVEELPDCIEPVLTDTRLEQGLACLLLLLED